MRPPTGESLNFFVELEKPGEYLMIQTYGGSGDLDMTATGNAIVFGFDDFFEFFEDDKFFEEEGRQRPGDNLDSEQVTLTSNGIGTEQMIYLDLPANGRFDITVVASQEISEVTIVASWVYSDFIEPIDEPEAPQEPIVSQNCRDVAENEMNSKDKDANGVLSKAELDSVILNGNKLDFANSDLNVDGEIEFSELLQISCSCNNELELIFTQLSPADNEVTIEKLSSQVYENQYNFFDIDSDSNLRISRSEIDILILLCDTTFDAFDGDGDGVPDVDDAFPNDPDETKDTDGDGVGDNADLAPSVANDLIYSAGAILAIGLLAMLVLVSRSSRGRDVNSAWESDKQYSLAEQMLDMQDSPITMEQQIEAPQNSYELDNDVSLKEIVDINPTNNDNLFEELLSQPESPPTQLLGMIDSNGIEVIEFPVGSGNIWQRSNPNQSWMKK